MSIPDIPYDNLYKFMAISGLILIILSLIFPFSYFYLTEKYSDDIVKKIKLDTQLDSITLERQKLTEEFDNTTKLVFKKLNELNISLQNLSDKKSKLDEKRNNLEQGTHYREFAVKTLKNSSCFEFSEENNISSFTTNFECLKNTSPNIQNTFVAISLINRQVEEYNNQSSNLFQEFLQFNESTDNFSIYINAMLSNRSNSIEQLNNLNKKESDIVITEDYIKSSLNYQRYKTLVKMEDDINLYLMIPLLIIGVIMSFYGFKNWRVNQLILDESMCIDLEIKKEKLSQLKNKKDTNKK